MVQQMIMVDYGVKRGRCSVNDHGLQSESSHFHTISAVIWKNFQNLQVNFMFLLPYILFQVKCKSYFDTK